MRRTSERRVEGETHGPATRSSDFRSDHFDRLLYANAEFQDLGTGLFGNFGISLCGNYRRRDDRDVMGIRLSLNLEVWFKVSIDCCW